MTFVQEHIGGGGGSVQLGQYNVRTSGQYNEVPVCSQCVQPVRASVYQCTSGQQWALPSP